MPVPSSFNDLVEDRYIRDFVGWSWYDRKFFLPSTFDKDKQVILLRFESVHYMTIIYLNGKHLLNHTGGYLPFDADITDYVKLNEENHLSVAVNNELTKTTIPQGSFKIMNDSANSNAKFAQSKYSFDFFNYAGIQRSVILYFVPKIRIVDIDIFTKINGNIGIIDYNIKINSENLKLYNLEVFVLDKNGKLINSSKNEYKSSFEIENAKLWWPYTMMSEPGYLYQLRISIYDNNNYLLDRYYQKVGIREVKLSHDNRFLVNNKPFYFRGFGKHEEYDIRGRSYDPVMTIKDFNLIKWIGANSFRTSHYPYSEQLMDQADSQGIVVIDECPAISLNGLNVALYKQHLYTLKELIERDKNRPSVFMWSIANEPVTTNHNSKEYFYNIYTAVKKIDSTRPITAATGFYATEINYLPPILDVIMVNRYFAWYNDIGYPQIVYSSIIKDLETMFKNYSKPILVSEYGTDTISGMHYEPSTAFSEDYQVEVLSEYHRGFDKLRASPFFIGEHIWAFADFMTQQTTTRVGGNKKGIFTRQRQPKSSARLLRCRYWKLANVSYHENNQIGFSYCPTIFTVN